LYWNSTANQLYVWDGSAWDEAAFNATGAVVSFNTRSGAVTLTSTDVTDALTFTPLGNADIGVSIQAYDTNLTSFVSTFTLPTTDGTSGQVVQTDGSGNLTFVTAASGISTGKAIAMAIVFG